MQTDFDESDPQAPTPGDGDLSSSNHAEDAASTGEGAGANPGRRRWLLVSAVSVAIIGLMTGAVVLYLQVRGDLRDTELNLAKTERDLAATTGDLEDTSTQLGLTESRLEATTTERDRLQRQADRLRTDLEGLRGSLEEAQGIVELQTGHIAVLQTCLSGVSDALYYASFELYNAAINSLSRVDSECDQAYALF